MFVYRFSSNSASLKNELFTSLLLLLFINYYCFFQNEDSGDKPWMDSSTWLTIINKQTEIWKIFIFLCPIDPLTFGGALDVEAGHYGIWIHQHGSKDHGIYKKALWFTRDSALHGFFPCLFVFVCFSSGLAFQSGPFTQRASDPENAVNWSPLYTKEQHTVQNSCGTFTLREPSVEINNKQRQHSEIKKY